jgi:hypothetical protein
MRKSSPWQNISKDNELLMTTTSSSDVATNYDFNTTAALSEDEGTDAFLKSFGIEDTDGEDADLKKKKPSEESAADTTKEDDAESEGAEEEKSDESLDDEADSDETEATDKDAEEDKSKKKSFVDSEDTYVKVKVGNEEREVTVKDLKRLYGQEASLTRKSQEVADQRRIADEGVAKNVAALNVMFEKAKAKAAPYAAIDWLAVSKNPNISAEEASALRDEAKAAMDDVSFFEKDLGSLMTAVADKQKAETVAQAKVCISTLSTPSTADKPNPLHIEGWSDKVYDDLRSFARELGAEPNAVNAMVDPVAFKILHMAMQFKRGSSKVLTVKTNKSPKKIVKTTSSSSASKAPASTTDRNKAVANLKRSGSEDDAVNAFLAGMADKD